MRGLFVTGTDTGVGKTWISAAIIRSLVETGRKVGALKPIATSGEIGAHGAMVTPDALVLREALGDPASDLPEIAPIVLPGELAPSVAMRIADRILSFEEIRSTTRHTLAAWADRAEIVIVEGVGGLLCPICEDATVADLAIALDYPLVIVARRGLGTLSHTLLTVEAAKHRGLRVAAVVLNGSEPTTNPEAEATNAGELAGRLGEIPIVADIPHDLPAPSRSRLMIDVDWWGRAGTPRL